MNYVQRVMSIFLVASAAISCIAQVNTAAVPVRQGAAGDRVAKQIDLVRKEKGLEPLRRVTSAAYDVRLACSMAVTGKALAELTHMGSTDRDLFQTYQTEDTTNRNSVLVFLASDIELKRKDFPNYSVVVFSDSKRPDTFVIAISRMPSKFGHWWGCSSLNLSHLFGDGCNDQLIPKPTIAPECFVAK